MNNETTQEENKTEILETSVEKIQIPLCCQEGWASCPHVVRRQRPAKRNIGL